MKYKHNKHKDNPEKDQKSSKLTQAVSGVPMSEQLKFGNGSMYYERINRFKPNESYKKR
ncbi:MAG TPA: hypothetical protein VJ912_01765 [Candidatus Nanoarchaeia archaeon]|nr:hypothetical protein [Candidatus Nanoarchaeia archaeon]